MVSMLVRNHLIDFGIRGYFWLGSFIRKKQLCFFRMKCSIGIFIQKLPTTQKHKALVIKCSMADFF